MDYLSAAVNLFSFRYTDDMAENSALCAALFTVTVGGKVKAHSKHGPLAGSEMTARSGRPSWLLRPQVHTQHTITICPSFVGEIRIRGAASLRINDDVSLFTLYAKGLFCIFD